jgi:hypothetical protein
MQRAGLEWFHRLVHHPIRLSRRYLYDDPPVLFSLLGESLKCYWPEVVSANQLHQGDELSKASSSFSEEVN